MAPALRSRGYPSASPKDSTHSKLSDLFRQKNGQRLKVVVDTGKPGSSAGPNHVPGIEDSSSSSIGDLPDVRATKRRLELQDSGSGNDSGPASKRHKQDRVVVPDSESEYDDEEEGPEAIETDKANAVPAKASKEAYTAEIVFVELPIVDPEDEEAILSELQVVRCGPQPLEPQKNILSAPLTVALKRVDHSIKAV